MPSSQAPTSTKEAAGFTLHTERLGPLPLINHFIERIGHGRGGGRQCRIDLAARLRHGRLHLGSLLAEPGIQGGECLAQAQHIV